MNCRRCGLCCQGRGDLWYGEDDGSDCSQLLIKDGIATCLMQGDKRSFCNEYPFPDIDDGLCEQQMRMAAVFGDYLGIPTNRFSLKYNGVTHEIHFPKESEVA